MTTQRTSPNSAVPFIQDPVLQNKANAEWQQRNAKNNPLNAGNWIDPTFSAGANTAGWNTLQAFVAGTSAGAEVIAPAGLFLFNGPTPLAVGMSVQGQGETATIFSYSHAGDGMTMTSPINSSTAVHTKVKNLQLRNTNGANTGGAYVDVGGTFVQVENILTTGWAYGTILDQSELADIINCDYEGCNVGGVWLANGPDHTLGASGGFTNRISVQQCQFNGTGIGIIDDGGGPHKFIDNNINGGTIGIRISGAFGVEIGNTDFEGMSGAPIAMEHTTLKLGGGVGGVTLDIHGCSLTNQASAGAITVNVGESYMGIYSHSNVYGGSGTKITGAANMDGGVVSDGDFLVGGTLTDNDTFTYSPSENNVWTPVLNIGGSPTGITYTTQSAYYQKYGPVITYALMFRLTAKGTNSGAVTITGLPFENNFDNQFCNPPYITGVTGATAVGGYLLRGSSVINLTNGLVNSSGTLQDTNISATTQIFLNGTFFL